MDKPPAGFHSTKGVGKTMPNPAESVTLYFFLSVLLPSSHGSLSSSPDGTVVPLGRPVPTPNLAYSALLYNEYIVYDVAQAHMRYLVKLKFHYK
jgi:poly [ADP-ribose] polymerase